MLIREWFLYPVLLYWGKRLKEHVQVMGDIVSIEIEAWRLLLVPFLLMFSLFVIGLIMKYSPVKDENEKKTLTSWITKKDILYWSLIVCIVAIGIFTFQYKNDGEVISHWGFAGTIVSIILAVIAIGFTLFQTLTHSLSSEKIEKSAERIEKASTELDSTKLEQASEIITNTSKYIAEFNANVEVRLEKITEEIMTMRDVHLNYNSRLDTLFFNKEENEGNESSNLNEKSLNIDLEDFFDRVFPRLAEIPRFFLYSTFFFSHTDTLKNSKNRFEFVFKVTEFQMDFRLEDEDKHKNRVRRIRRQGANMGSLGAVTTLVDHLGILKDYRDKDERSRMVLLEKAGRSISTENKEFLEQFNVND